MNNKNKDKNSKEILDNNEIRKSDFDTFFADLDNIEDDILSEAYDLVVHALSLIEGHYYDDAIEVLRQAIGLYNQINRNAEIEALNKKISDIYLLKEQHFRETETEFIVQGIEKQDDKNNILQEAYDLIEEGKNLLNLKKFEDTLDKYDKAIDLFKKANNNDEIDKINKLIEECYNKKAEYLRKSKLIEEPVEIKDYKEISEEELRHQRIIAFREAKKHEEDISNRAFEIISKASDLANIHDFDQALNLYIQGATLFEDINWVNEAKKVRTTIEQLEKEKEIFNAQMEKVKTQKESQRKLKEEKVSEYIEKAKIEEKAKITAQAEKMEDITKRREEEESFKNMITEMVNHAEKLAREYDLEMKKAIKKGYLLEDCVYPEVIGIYEKVKKMVADKGWTEQVVIYSNQIIHYNNLLGRDKNLRKIELEKLQKQKEYEALHKIKKETKISDLELERIKLLEEQKRKGEEEAEFRRKIDEMVNNAEKAAREYDIKLKKAVKKGDLNFESEYPEIINTYKKVQELVQEKGFEREGTIYSKQIQKYENLLEKENKLRKIEEEKVKKQREYEELHKIKKGGKISDLKHERIKLLEEQKRKGEEEAEFRRKIDEMVNNAEKAAREYDIKLKKAVKKGDLNFESEYPEIINIYKKVQKLVLEKGLEREGTIYLNQIQKYENLLEKENRLRELEEEKIKKQREFQEVKKIKKDGEIDIQKLKEIEAKKKLEQEDEIFENEIDQMVDAAEKEAREYEIAIKRGNFEKQCPYPKIIEIYKNIRERVYARGWSEEGKIYTNQIIIYKEKLERDNKLREIEAKKEEKKKEFEESIRASEKIISLKMEKLQKVEEKDRQKEELLNKAMSLINKAENEVKSYELSMKKDLLIYQSPYEKAISNYEKAKKIFREVGWAEEAHRLLNTISFYKEKKERDDKLRELEKERLEKGKLEEARAKYIPEQMPFAREEKIIKFEKFKKEESKDSEAIFSLINKAERLSQEYEVKKKDGLLNINSPYQEIIDLYKVAKKKFEEIGWKEQANQLVNSINHYKQKLEADNKLRAMEIEKIEQEKKEEEKTRLEVKLAREAEAELLKQKAQSLELKRKQALEYESKKEQAFNFMDLAKNELKQNDFDKAIRFYKESEKIFTEINWLEGIRMINDSIKVIKNKKEAIEREKKLLKEKEQEKLRMKIQLEEQIIKAKDLKDLQEEKRRQELLAIQKQQEYEKEVSQKAYKLLEGGTALKNMKKFEEAYEKYIMGRDLFEKIGWVHEVSRINNDLLFILKKEMKQTEKIRAMQKRKLEEEKELEILLKEAEVKRKELEKVRKEEKRKKRELIIQDRLDEANTIIKDLKYNEGILKLNKVIRKLGKIGQNKQIKQINKQIEILTKASQIPLITVDDIYDKENIEKFTTAYRALDRAQISLSENQFMKAISELKEAKYNLKATISGKKYIPLIKEKIKLFKKELGIKLEVEPEVKLEKTQIEEINLKDRIAARRAERKKRVKELLEKK